LYHAAADDPVAVGRASAYTSFWGGGGAGWYDAKSGAVTQKVCSENLFAKTKKKKKIKDKKKKKKKKKVC
jgi:hypothetical protein